MGYELTGILVNTGSQGVAITRIRAVVGDAVDDLMSANDWSNHHWTLNVFSADASYPQAADALDSQPRHGNHTDNEQLALAYNVFQQGPDYYVTFTVAIPILLDPHSEYLISLRAEKFGGPASKPSFRHNLASALGSDYLRSYLLNVTPYSALGLSSGVAAVDIYGY